MTIVVHLAPSGVWFICETPLAGVLAHSVMLYYILQIIPLPNWGDY